MFLQSVKKAKQFELRKLIRRLKASTDLGQGNAEVVANLFFC